jgi:putative ABC transport system permease protein
MKIGIQILLESFILAYSSLAGNKLRSFLSLLSITVGIFSIIAVFTMVDSMENKITSSVESLGDDVIFIQKWPWAPEEGDEEYAWWKYFQRPEPQMADLMAIQKRSQSAAASSFTIFGSRDVRYQNNEMNDVEINGVSYHFQDVKFFNLSSGRYFTEAEVNSGRPFAVIGSTVAQELFPSSNPIDKEIKIKGKKLRVIGVFEKEGESMIGNSLDEVVVVPAGFGYQLLSKTRAQSLIMVKAKKGISNDMLKSELTAIMRSVRKLAPRADNDFSLNETSVVLNQLSALFGVVNIVGLIIGGFSMLVGGFSIANIMFVSVKERTKQIGIQKALGAKNYFVLLQFLFEAIALSLIGGLFGLVLVFIGTLIFNSVGFETVLSFKNVLKGVSFSILIGLISGIIPAWMAARLDPVEAMRAG